MEVLSNKSYKDYSYVSRYAPFPYYHHNIDNKYFYGITAYLKDTTVYKTHIIEQGDTLDSLALDYYNNPSLYWIICSFNHIRNPYIQLTPGDKIKIPSIANIEYDFQGRN